MFHPIVLHDTECRIKLNLGPCQALVEKYRASKLVETHQINGIYQLFAIFSETPRIIDLKIGTRFKSLFIGAHILVTDAKCNKK